MKYFKLMIVFLAITSTAAAQFPAAVQDNINKQVPNPLPPSPNVASLGKFGDYKVSYFTGIPDISIPLYEVKSGSLSVPITLSYHASGVKPTDVASWVGLGWALSAGGQVSRSIRGKPDEVSYATQALRTSPQVCGPPGVGAFNYLKDIATGIIDADPDIYSYSYPGGSGKFVLPYGQSPYLFPFAPIVVNPFALDKFEITNQSGVLFKFGNSASARESTNSQTGGSLTTGTTAWLLTNIVAPNSNDAISLQYQETGTVSQSDVMYVQSIVDLCNSPTGDLCPPNPLPQAFKLNSTTDQKGLQRIIFENGKVEFTLSNFNRLDQPQLKSLDSITVYSLVNGTYLVSKSIRFRYSYFVNADGSNTALKLQGIDIRGAVGAAIQTYSFSYFTESLPWSERGNYLNQRDLWGYFNGASNTDLVLRRTLSDYQETNLTAPTSFTFGGAIDRSVNPSFAKHGVLKRIDFPTGGYTEFDFESNRYSDGSSKLAGGLRVTRIASSEGSGSSPIVKTYKYGLAGSGFGLINFTPWQYNYFSEQRYYSDCEMVVGKPMLKYRIRTYYSNSTFSPSAFEASSILYPYVSEYIGDYNGSNLGRIDYVFDGGVPETDVVDQIVPNTTSFYKENKSWKRGLLTSKKVVDANGVAISSSSYSYSLYNATASKLIGYGVGQYVTGTNACSQSSLAGMGDGASCISDSGPETVNTNTFFSAAYSQSSGSYLVYTEINSQSDPATLTSVSSMTTNIYLSNLQLKQSTVRKSSYFEQEVTINTYPSELPANSSSAGPAKGIYMVKSKNILDTPVETYTYVQNIDGTNSRVISGQLVIYKQNPNNSAQVVADSVLILEGSLPFPLSSFTPVAINGANSGTVRNSNYRGRVKMLNYDSDGNLLNVAKTNDIVTSYVYGYNNSVPIAKIGNAISGEYKFENFEELTPSATIINSASAHSGRQYYLGDYTISFSIPNSRSYLVDYWYLDANSKWQYIRKSYSGTSMILSEGSAIDDVRVYPTDAQTMTYTYDILNGFTSEIDTNGRTTSYEYDPFGRLAFTRDVDGNIVKGYQYHYRGQ